MFISGMPCSNSFTQYKALAEFLIFSHDNQVSAWVQQEKQNVRGELHFPRHLPRRNSTKESALWIDYKFYALLYV